jgi:hypothetical protein
MYPPLVLTAERLTGFPPSNQTNCLLHTFCVDGDREKIQATLDNAFATPSGGAVRYEAVGSKLFLSIAEIARMFSMDPVDAPRGWMSEIDVTLWAFARKEGTLDLRWIPLWLFVDAPPAFATGREVYGFPKQFGRFDFSPRGGDRRRFLTSAFALAEFTPETQADWAPLIECAPSDAPPEEGAGVIWRGLEGLADGVIGRLRSTLAAIDEPLLNAALGTFRLGKSTLAFLKQFPDAADPHRACYQAIIEADCVAKLRSAGLTPEPYRLTFHPCASHPFTDQLGISADPQDVGHGVVVDFDFTLSLGREVWRAQPLDGAL